MTGVRSGGGVGGLARTSLDDGPIQDNSSKDEELSTMEGRETKPTPAPVAMLETVSIRICPKEEKLKINLRVSDNRVTWIRKDSPFYGKLCIGDKILKLDDKTFHYSLILKPDKTLKDSDPCKCDTNPEYCTKHKSVKVIQRYTIERAVYSWSRLDMTTLEQQKYYTSNKKTKIVVTGRPIKRYTVILRRPRLPGLDIVPLGISLRYDSRERVTVAATEPGSVASTHLRPWDIIKRVNGDSVYTKAMCAFMILKSLRHSGQVILSIDSLGNADSSRDTMEMPEDVVAICAKQVAVMKSATLSPGPPISVVRPPVSAEKKTAAAPTKAPSLRKAAPAVRKEGEKRITHAEGKPKVVEIMSSVEEGTILKSSKMVNDKN